MRVLTFDIFDRWTRGVGLVALTALVWALVVPNGMFWSAVLATSLLGAAIATTVLVRSRQVPTLAQVVASAAAAPVLVPTPSGYTSGAGLRSIGERKS